ncbi:porin [Variovorax sp. dw_954]|uniref:porin n=1 Tax=Variovorax sp. dw_954 TaxID=2720078 RepID=UPI001BD41642|nr:porin [Variovorax sp. dw_954]
MKKSLVALAALAVAGVASAQSSVTLFGVVDAAVSYYQTNSKFVGFAGTPVLNAIGTGDLKQSQWQMSNSGYNSSRLGFRGTEDLGGGLAASFWLESSISNDDGVTGASQFSRRSTVSLSGGFGELRLGRDYTPTFWNDTVFDPFGTNGVGTNLIFSMSAGPRTLVVPPGGGVAINRGLFSNANYIRASNSVGYFLPPNLGGFYGQAMYAFNEAIKYDPGTTTPNVLNSQRTGRYVGGRFGYANGGLDIAAAYGESTTGDDFYAGQTTTVKTANLGASYDFGVVKLFGELSRTKNDIDVDSFVPVFGTGSFKGDGYLLGATVPVGPGLIRVAYSAVKLNYTSTPTLATIGLGTFNNSDPKADKFAIGYVHNLSKRTALYATAAFVKNKNGLNLNANSDFTKGPQFTNTFLLTPNGGYQADKAYGYDFGIRHAF